METLKSHEEMRQELLAKAAQSNDFRTQLVSDPKSAIYDTFGLDLPDAVSVEVHEDTATKAHLVLPPMASLSDADLEVVAGGHRKLNVYGANDPHSHNAQGEEIW